MSTTAFHNIALLGATGNLGSKILKALTDAGFSVTAIQRASSTNVAAGAAKSVKVDLTSESELAAALKGFDVVISAVANPRLDTEKKMIDAAISVGVKRIVPSEFSSNLENKAVQAVPIVEEKLKIRRYLETVAAAGKIEWTSVNNGAFFVSWLWTSGPVGPNVQSKTAVYHDGGDRVVCTTAPERIAEGVVKALSPEHAVETKNKSIYVYSAAVTERKLTTMVTAITGIQFEVQERSTAEAMRVGLEGFKENDYGKTMSLYIAIMMGDGYGGDFRSTAWNEKLGLPPMDDAAIEKTLRGWLA